MLSTSTRGFEEHEPVPSVDVSEREFGVWPVCATPQSHRQHCGEGRPESLNEVLRAVVEPDCGGKFLIL
jgi:hypothetical protein